MQKILSRFIRERILFLFQPKGFCEEKVVGMAGGEGEFAGFGEEIAVEIIESEHFFRDGKGDGFDFTGSQGYLLKSDEGGHGTDRGGHQILQIQLHHLFAGPFPGVLKERKY